MLRFCILAKYCRTSGVRLLSLQQAFPEQPPHLPVMAREVIQYLDLQDNETIIDMTLGGGGHSKLLLNLGLNIKLFGLDRDPAAFEYTRKYFENCPNFTHLHGKFSDLPNLLEQHRVKPGTVDSILFDFGCSSMQFDQAERGFSINKNGPLDMRMDNSPSNTDPTAAEVLYNIKEEDLAKILRAYGEEKQAKKIARAIVEARYQGVPLQTTHDLSNLVATVLGSDHRLDKLQRHAHSSTKVFQALRIFVNNELNEINYGMIIAYHYLKMHGKLVTLTFHSLEDKIVKRHLSGNVNDNAVMLHSMKCMDSGSWHEYDDIIHLMDSNWKQINKHVITPLEEELIENPRSRSAKLRAAIKIK